MLAAITWKPGINDPTVIGWVATIGYGLAAYFCLMRWFHSRRNHPEGRALSTTWLLLAVGLLLLGLNKQLDLQTLLVQSGRQTTIALGWFEERRKLQFTFALLFGTIVITLFAVSVRRYGNFFRKHLLATIGTGLILSYVLLRSASVNHLGEGSGKKHHAIQQHWVNIIELAGIACVLICAAGWKRSEQMLKS